jgi:uncharacterized protein
LSIRAAVEEHLAAFNAHDPQRLLAGFTPDAVWITGADTFTGRAALADVFDDWLWSLQPHLDVHAVLVDGGRAAVQAREAITIDGERQQFQIAVFFEFADGLITRAKVYREGSADL